MIFCTYLSRRTNPLVRPYRHLCSIIAPPRTARLTSLIYRDLCSNAPSSPPPGIKIPGFDMEVIPMDFNSEIKKVLTEHEKDKKWSQTPEARNVLGKGAKTPLPSTSFINNDVDMSSYMSLRGFTDDADKQYDLDTSAYRTLSAAMTFPLTLGYGIQQIFPNSMEDGPAHSFQSHILSQNRKLRVCVLGARAESSLPLLWWREALIYSLARSQQQSICANGLEVTFVGPEMQGMRADPIKNDLSTSISMTEKKSDLRIYQYPNGKYMLHAMDNKNLSQILLHSDVFVLFNPGLGHPALTENWRETFSLLLQTKKPILCTAYHKIDLERDMKFVEDITAEIDEGDEGLDLGEPLQWICRAHTNPFASGRRTVDKKEEKEGQIVRTNEFLYAFQAK